MGTRSIIGQATDSGFEGRYCHWDGYPTGRGPALMQTYRELDGDLDAVIAYAIRPDVPGYWSSFLPPSKAAENDAKPERTTCQLCAGTGVRLDGRFQERGPNCNGCSSTGLAQNPDRTDTYRTDNGNSWATQSDDWGAEFAYLLSKRGVDVLAADWSDDNDTVTWQRIGFVEWTDENPDWEAIEQAVYQTAS